LGFAPLRVIEGKNGGKNDERPRIPFKLGKSSFIGIYDLSSSINILSYHAYENISCYLDDPELEPIDVTIRLFDRTSKKFCGIIHNTQVPIGNFIYPIDFYIIDLTYKPFSTIILRRPFFVLTKTNIERKKELISLQARAKKVLISPKLQEEALWK
jgi:hypothetical protein